MVGARYAKALFRAGKEGGELDKIYSDIKKLKEVFKSDVVKHVFYSPSLSTSQKLEILRDVFENVLESELTKNFLKVVMRKRREKYLDEMLYYFELFYEREKNIEKVFVKFASEPSNEDVKKIKEKLEKVLGKKVEISVSTDPSLVAGVEISGFDWTVKMSAKSLCEAIAKQLEI